jgi:hypothetical protein
VRHALLRSIGSAPAARRPLAQPARLIEAEAEVELVHLTDQVDTEAVVWLLLEQDEAARHVDPARRFERMVGPQPQPGVAGPSGEVHAGVHESPAEARPPFGRFDEQDSQLRRVVVGGDAQDRPDATTVELGDPGGLPRRVVAVGEVGHDPRHEGFEGRVPSELGGVELAVALHHPAQVTGLAQCSDHRLLTGHGPSCSDRFGD